jgi:hypothetical protein
MTTDILTTIHQVIEWFALGIELLAVAILRNSLRHADPGRNPPVLECSAALSAGSLRSFRLSGRPRIPGVVPALDRAHAGLDTG